MCYTVCTRNQMITAQVCLPRVYFCKASWSRNTFRLFKLKPPTGNPVAWWSIGKISLENSILKGTFHLRPPSFLNYVIDVDHVRIEVQRTAIAKEHRNKKGYTPMMGSFVLDYAKTNGFNVVVVTPLPPLVKYLVENGFECIDALGRQRTGARIMFIHHDNIKAWRLRFLDHEIFHSTV